MESQPKIEILNPQPTEQTPHIIEDYPWGYHLRTQQRVYVETVKGKGKGQRLVTQTKNPKNGQWCAPKKSIYSEIIIVIKNLENGHIEHISFSTAYTGEAELENFLKRVPETSLSEYQRKQVAIARAIYRTRKHITYNMVTNPTEEQTKEIEENNKKVNAELGVILNHYTGEELDKAGLK